jgi:two-component system CheB/CheR fusion protein
MRAFRQAAMAVRNDGQQAASKKEMTTTTHATTDSASPAVPIVGIGASAGGLDALKKLFSSMPADIGMTFVLVPHLDPSHESLMAELLAKQTGMRVQEAADGSKVQANHVYIIPPNQSLTVAEGVLHLSPPPDDRRLYGAMDTFLCSLAEDQQQRAIGIVLSGTGQHGVQGLRAIKAAGGMVIAQRPDTAAFPSMPKAAVDAGVADFELPPEEMPDTSCTSNSNSAWRTRRAKSACWPKPFRTWAKAC